MARKCHQQRCQRYSLLTKFVVVFLFFPCICSAKPPEEMKLIPSGYYYPLYSKSDDSIKRKIKGKQVQSFLIDDVPVSNENYLLFVKKHIKWQRGKIKSLFANKSYLGHWKSDLELGDKAPKKAPVTNVSWFSARAYCASFQKRLPTTAEWEYVASADPSIRYAAQKDDQFAKRILEWYGKPNDLPLSRVRSNVPNFYGVYDLHGLVWEWVQDFNTALVTGESRGDSSLERQLYCGSGAVGSSDFRNYAAFMRYSFRSSLKANYCIENLGFRCVRDSKGD